MRVRLLGTIDVVMDGEARSVGGLRRRALLATLVLQRGIVVDKHFLVDVVWNRTVPVTVANSMQSHISYLRTLIGDKAAIRYRPPGYVFEADGEETDVETAERLIQRATRTSDLHERARILWEALALWRGQTLADVAGLPWLEEQADRLELLRARAARALLKTRLELGEHAGLLPELEQLVRDQPLDEQLHGHLILALYRAGRQVESLGVYQRLRRSLNDELGIDPTPELRALETGILRQDPGLQLPATMSALADRTEGLGTAAETAETTVVVMAGRPVPAQLPGPTAAFTGRHKLLARLDELLAPEAGDRLSALGGRRHGRGGQDENRNVTHF